MDQPRKIRNGDVINLILSSKFEMSCLTHLDRMCKFCLKKEVGGHVVQCFVLVREGCADITVLDICRSLPHVWHMLLLPYTVTQMGSFLVAHLQPQLAKCKD